MTKLKTIKELEIEMRFPNIESEAVLTQTREIYNEIDKMLKEEDCSHLEELKSKINGENKK